MGYGAGLLFDSQRNGLQYGRCGGHDETARDSKYISAQGLSSTTQKEFLHF